MHQLLAMIQIEAEMLVRLSSSGSSASSLSSTFSDTTCSTFATSSSPPHSKTNAFFGSPFSTRPPTPDSQQFSAPRRVESKYSLTTDSFAAPTMQISSSLPSSILTSKTSRNSSRFTSRILSLPYTSTAHQSPEFQFAQPDEETHYSHLYDYDALSLGDSSQSSFSSALENNTRLPTPPPLPFVPRREATSVQHSPSETADQSTPRPPHIEPYRPSPLFTRAAPKHVEMGIDDLEVDELKIGSIIYMPLSNITMVPSPFPSPQLSTFNIDSPELVRRSPTLKSTNESLTHSKFYLPYLLLTFLILFSSIYSAISFYSLTSLPIVGFFRMLQNNNQYRTLSISFRHIIVKIYHRALFNVRYPS